MTFFHKSLFTEELEITFWTNTPLSECAHLGNVCV